MPPPRIPLAAPRSELPCDRQLWLAIAGELALSPQQQRITELLLLGYQDKQIAEELQLSVPTVRTYLKRIFDRVGVADRVGLLLHVFAMAQQRSNSASH
jgi:DNA-binding NarL/FixJ family response regulator